MGKRIVRKLTQYELKLYLQDSYKQPGRPDHFTKTFPTLKKAVKYAGRHTDRRVVCWAYWCIYERITEKVLDRSWVNSERIIWVTVPEFAHKWKKSYY